MICWIQGLKWFCFWLSIGPSSSVRVQGAWVWEPLWRAGKFRRLWLHVTNPETWGWGPGLATCQVVKWWEQWEAGALPFPADWPSVSVITSLSLYFFICKMGTLLLTRQNWRVSRDRHVLGWLLLVIGAWQVAVVFTTGVTSASFPQAWSLIFPQTFHVHLLCAGASALNTPCSCPCGAWFLEGEMDYIQGNASYNYQL